MIVVTLLFVLFFFFSSRRRHTRLQGDWSSDVCSSDLVSDMPPTLKMQSPCNVTGPSNSVVAEVPLLTVVDDPFPLKTKFLFQATLSAENESSAPASTMLVKVGSPMPGVRPENSMMPC